MEWITDCIAYPDEHGYAAVDAGPEAVHTRIATCAQRAQATLCPEPTRGTWAQRSRQAARFVLFTGGFAVYNGVCTEVAQAGYSRI